MPLVDPGPNAQGALGARALLSTSREDLHEKIKNGARNPADDLAANAPAKKQQQDQDGYAVPLQRCEYGTPEWGKESRKYARSIKGRERDHVERGEAEVDKHEDPQKLFHFAETGPRVGREAQYARGQGAQEHVGKRAGKSDEGHAAMTAESSGGPQAKIVHWNGPAPGDSGEAKRDQEEHQRANGVEVNHRIQADASEEARRVIAEHPRRPSMHELVNGDGDDKGNNDCRDGTQIKVAEAEHQAGPGGRSRWR